MNIYVSGGTAPQIDNYGNYRIKYISHDDWLSKLINDSQTDIFIWQYQYPWNNEEQKCVLNFEVMDEWCVQQQVIIDSIKKSKKTVFLFNQGCVSISDLLKKILNESGDESCALFNESNDIDKYYLSLISVWGKSYWDVIKKLGKLSFPPDSVKQLRKNKSAAKHKDILSSWLKFLSLNRQLHNENVEMKDNISLRFDELEKLTTMLESAHGDIREEKQKNSILTSMIDAKSVEIMLLMQQLQERDCSIANVQKEYELLKEQNDENTYVLNSKNIILEKNIKENNRQRDRYLEQIDLQKQEIASLKNIINLQKEENEKSNINCSVLMDELESSKKSINNRYSELAAITSMLEGSRREVISLQEQLAAANGKNIEIKNSLSWRVTAPIRALRHPTKFKKDKHRKKIEESISIIKKSNLFDSEWYLAKNPDVRESKIDPARHYLLFGGFEGRDPSTNFSSQGYLELYPDVKESSINPLEHYIRYGVREERVVVKN